MTKDCYRDLLEGFVFMTVMLHSETPGGKFLHNVASLNYRISVENTYVSEMTSALCTASNTFSSSVPDFFVLNTEPGDTFSEFFFCIWR